MINVPIDRIVPLTDARDNFSKIVSELEGQHDGMYVLTKGGKPAIALINVNYLAELMEGKTVTPESKPVVKPVEEKKPEIAKPVYEAPKAPNTIPAIQENKPEISKPTPPPISQPAAPKAPEAPAKPAIDPSWLEKSAPISQPAAPVTPPAPTAPISEPVKPRPVNPWPILTPKPAAPSPAPQMTPPISQPAVPVTPPMSNMNPAPTMPQMTPPVAPPTPPTAPKMPEVAPAAPINTTTTPVAVPINAPKPPMTSPSTLSETRPVMPPPAITPTPASPVKPDLPPPPANPTTIPFDEPPKTSAEPGEEMPEIKPAAPLPTNGQPAAPQQAMPQPPVQSSIQDIEI